MVEKSSKDAGQKAARGLQLQSQRNKNPQSFGREYSLNEDLAIKRVFESGKKYKGSCLSIYYYGKGSLPLKIVFRVSKKNGSAPRRNKIKRIMREIIRTNRDLFEPFGHMVISTYIKPELVSPYKLIEKDLFSFAETK
jgi:ribonuclease P protein component